MASPKGQVLFAPRNPSTIRMSPNPSPNEPDRQDPRAKPPPQATERENDSDFFPFFFFFKTYNNT